MDVMQATSDDPRRSKRHPMRTAAPTCDLSRPRSPERAARPFRPLPAWCACALVAITGCTASSNEVHPPADELFFPSGLAIAPDESALFVANANSELRYDSGAISVLPVPAIQAALDAWLVNGDPGGCERESDHQETLVCSEETFMDVNAGVRIGNFATDIALQAFASGKYRVFVPTRGDPSIAWADFSEGALHCATSGDSFALCDDAHRLSQIANDPDNTAIPEEPFGVFADGPNGFAMVSHLNTGAVTLIAAPEGTDDGPADVRVVDVGRGFFAADANGSAGATSIAERPGGVDGEPLVYVGSRSDHRVQTFTIGMLPVIDPGAPVDPANPPPTPEPAYLLPSEFFLLTEIGNVVGGSIDTRGLRFSEDGNRLFLINRRPPSLQIYDTSIGEGGFPRNTGLGGIDICRQASQVEVMDNGAGERAYISCFQDGQLYIVNPNDLTQPEDILLVGRGPYSIASSKLGARKLLFVSNFLEDTIAVVDVTPGSRTYNRVVLRIGQPRIL